jgi:hypothetical protein
VVYPRRGGRWRRWPIVNTSILSLAKLTALVQVVIIDVTLAGENALVVGTAAAG